MGSEGVPESGARSSSVVDGAAGAAAGGNRVAVDGDAAGRGEEGDDVPSSAAVTGRPMLMSVGSLACAASSVAGGARRKRRCEPRPPRYRSLQGKTPWR